MLIFPQNRGNGLTNQATNIANLMRKFFNYSTGMFPSKKCIKPWVTLCSKNLQKLDEDVRKFFESNTVHRDKLKKYYYAGSLSNEEALGLF